MEVSVAIEVIAGLVGLVGALAGAVGVLVRVLIVSKDNQIADLILQRDAWRRRAQHYRRELQLDTHSGHAHPGLDPDDTEEDDA